MIETASLVTSDVRLAGMPVRIAAEEGVARFVMTPFAHLVEDRQSCLSKLAGTGRIACPPSPLLTIHVRALDRHLDVPETGVVATSDGGDTITHTLPDCVAVYRRAARTIEARVREEGSASWRRAKPLQLVLSVFFADHGIDLVHAGVVSLGGHGILFAGMGGSGKSTAAIASLLDGFDFLGDDCVGIRETEAFSVFGSGCLHPEHARKVLPSAVSLLPSDDKQVVPLADFFPERMLASTTLRAIVLPRVTHAGRVTLHAVSGAEAMRTLAPSSILKRAVPAADTFARIAKLVRQLPSYRLEMGPVAEIGPALRRLLS